MQQTYLKVCLVVSNLDQWSQECDRRLSFKLEFYCLFIKVVKVSLVKSSLTLVYQSQLQRISQLENTRQLW